MTDLVFQVRPYSKRDLARLYFPDAPMDKTAVRNLRNLMVRNAELLAELQSAGCKRYEKFFTPKQVRIIVRYLGEP